jgi:transaldolase
MKFFIDTANADEIKKANDWGVLDGVTTNPSLIAKEGVPHKQRVLEICELVGPGKAVSAECVEVDYDKMLAEARDIATWHPNIYVKVPMTPAGIKVISTLVPEGVKFNCTLVFSLAQGLIAAKAGASFISFFVGRVDDIGSGEAMKTIAEAVDMVYTYDFPQKPEILVASIRSPLQILESIKAGAQIATIPYKVLELLFKHPLTDIGGEKFLADYRKSLEEAAKTA